MKKGFRLYLVIWTALLALFNVIAWAMPGWIWFDKYTPSFWIGYALIMITFAGQLVCSCVAFKEKNASKFFYKISLIKTSYGGLIASFILGGLCMLASPLIYWIALIVCVIVLVCNIVAVAKATAAANIVSNIDDKIKTQTFFIKSLTVDAETLLASAKSEVVKAECRKVYEAIRYSDPMSNDALSTVESQITVKFAELSEAVKVDDAERVAEIANEIVILIGDRNKKCKLLK